LSTLPGFTYHLQAGDIVSVTIVDAPTINIASLTTPASHGYRIFNLATSDFNVDVVNNKIVLHPSTLIGEPVLVKIVIQTKAFHLNGDFQFFFGDEPLQVGQPVVDSNNQLVLDGNGHVVLYTAATIVDSRGNQKFHRRGELVYTLVSTVWTPATYTTSDLRKYLGNEPVLYVGGEPAFFTSADAVETAQTYHQITLGQQPADPSKPSAANKVQLLGVVGTPISGDTFTLRFGTEIAANTTTLLPFKRHGGANPGGAR